MARAENAVPRPVPVDVSEVIRERVAAWQPVAGDRRVWLSSGAAEPVTVALGEGHLEQILDNLIANALDATAADDHITLSAQVVPEGSAVSSGVPAALRGQAAQDGGPAVVPDGAAAHRTAEAARAGAGRVVRLAVADDGPGMSPNDRARAFGRFTSASPGGTGLGLAIVHRLVTSNGGTASLEETPGGGLSVVIEFPAAPRLPADPLDGTGEAGAAPVPGS